MLKEHWINGLDNFICGWYIDADLCDSIIEYFKNSNEKYEGRFAGGFIDKSVKDSLDCKLNDETMSITYFSELQKCVDLYIEKYPRCNAGHPWKTIEAGNIQYYSPLAGYHEWHTERSSNKEPSASRHLVFITYLNDVTDRGETEFYHQKIKIRPERGLTIIWPADWTFTHRGIASPTQEKYIYTGWFNYYGEKS